MNKSIVFLVVLSIVALAVFFWSREKPEISRLDKIIGPEAENAVSAAKIVSETAKLDKDKELKTMLISMDETDFRDFKMGLKDLKSPEFSKAKVSSPGFNAEIYYVFVPEGKADTCQFTMRKKDGKLLLEGICRRPK